MSKNSKTDSGDNHFLTFPDAGEPANWVEDMKANGITNPWMLCWPMYRDMHFPDMPIAHTSI